MTAAVALALGGTVGALIGSSTDSSGIAASTPTVTVEAPAPQFTPTIPVAPDPVCAEWAPIADANAANQQEWATKSINQPASTWNAEQWDLNRAFIKVARENIPDMIRLAEKARDPFLAALMRAQAMYAEAFILRLPNYQPSDRPLWQASVDMSGAVRAACITVQPR